MKTPLKTYISLFPHGLMFHRFHRAGGPPGGTGSLTPEEFDRILLFVGIGNILQPDEWLNRLTENRLQNQDLCITLDDGLRAQYDICLPVLEKYGLKAFWFIFSAVFEEDGAGKFEIYNRFSAQYFPDMNVFAENFLARCPQPLRKHLKGNEFLQYAARTQAMHPFYSMNDLKFRFMRNQLLSQKEFEAILDTMIAEKGLTPSELGKGLWMTNAELKSLSLKGHRMGLHSYSHPVQFSNLSFQDQENEYRKNYDHIKSVCGQEIVTMSYSINSYNEDTLKVLSRLGIRCGFRSTMAAPSGKSVNPNGLELAREDSVNILKMMF